ASEESLARGTAFITQLYVAVFDRAPDAEGLAYWTDRWQDGMAADAIAASFVESLEASEQYADATDEQFVGQMYQHILGREADPSGLAYWAAQLAGGASRADIIELVLESAEGRSVADLETQVILAYQGLLGRAPTETELDAATRGADLGDVDAAVQAVVDGILDDATGGPGEPGEPGEP